jgi:pimeloyl-ACP methyl ester carboxylesterase
MTTFVLVHGGWHGAWCWERVVPWLVARGHVVAAPDLPGHGNDQTPASQASLGAYVNALCSLLDRQSDPVILAGHSMGGMVITQAAEERPERVRLLIYIAAFLPGNGQSLAMLTQGDTESLIPPNSEPTADGLAITLRDSALRDMLYADCPPEDLAHARARLLPEPLSPLAEPVRTTTERFGRVPRAYVECLRDRALPLARQREMQAALPCRTVVTIDTGHSPFFAAPRALADHLTALAAPADRV